MIAPPLIVVAGATATGKTELAIRLAEALHDGDRPVEIISADSRQVYRGLDIGTAKATEADRARIRHHGLDLVDPDQPFSVADFVEHAVDVLADLGGRNGVAILAGGTGFYLRAVGRGLDTGALPSDPAVRARLEAEHLADGLAPLAERLRSVAPTLATRTDLHNPRRVVRALEMAEVGGDILPPTPRGYPGPIAWLGLTVEPTTHTEWIGTRARAQFDAGLIEEAQALRERFDPGLPAFSAIGYREAWAVLDGLLTREAAIELDAKRNLAFARRQRTWFRSEPGITWLDATHKLPTAAGLALVRDVFQGQNGGIRMSDEPTVLFVCRHGAAKSVLAAAGLRRLAAGRGLRIVVDSAGIEPDAAVSPAVADALRRDGVDLAGLHPRLVRAAELTSAARVITFDLEPTELPIAAVDVERWDDVPPVGDAPDRAQAVIARHLEVLVDREFRSTPED